jgi:hypothetical protein
MGENSPHLVTPMPSLIASNIHFLKKFWQIFGNFLAGDLKNRNSKSFRKILGFHRTLSTDAIHTGCKGLVTILSNSISAPKVFGLFKK